MNTDDVLIDGPTLFSPSCACNEQVFRTLFASQLSLSTPPPLFLLPGAVITYGGRWLVYL